MNDAEFLALYRATLLAIETTVETAIQEQDAELDYESANDMLTLMFSNGSVAIISRQSAIRQLWLAARSGGFHFEHEAGSQQWICTVNGRRLQDMLQDICQEQGGVQLSFA